ncbi:MAG: hypothetical protein WHS64_02775 [Fervidobacterium sp.]|uniref:hypothetical protein n=1 Tax=Fervidobacterium sp. TaxID=1871331 RepID=UPI0030AAB35C
MHAKSGMKSVERIRIVTINGMLSALLFVLLYVGHLTPSEWTVIILVSYGCYLPYLFADTFFSGFSTVLAVNILGYVFIPRLTYVITFSFISLYIPVRWVVRNRNPILRWSAKYVYYNFAFFVWLKVESTLLGIDIIGDTSKSINRLLDTLPLEINVSNFLVLIIVILFGNLFFTGYEILFEKVLQYARKWINRLIGGKDIF